MDVEEIIKKKEKGKRLSYAEIFFMIHGFVTDSIDKQNMSRFIVSIYNNSLNKTETCFLCDAMLKQSKVLDLSELGTTIDKHSTGGVSDSTTLIVVPLFALLGFKCLKMSGGALGHTGGTADKIRVFSGLNNELDQASALEITKMYGGCFVTSSKELALADKKIYALRNEIDCVMNIPLIASSIMSKKIACGADNIVLDVKYGNGALMKNKAEAIKLGKTMKFIGEYYGKKVSIVYGDMNQPLGQCIGNYMEVLEVINDLKSHKKSNLIVHSIKIVSKGVAKLVGKTQRDMEKELYLKIKNGEVLEKLKDIVRAQGGDLKLFKEPFPQPSKTIFSEKQGKLKFVDCENLGLLDHELSQNPNYLGLKLLKKLGEKVNLNEPIIEIYYSKDFDLNIDEKLSSCLEIV